MKENNMMSYEMYEDFKETMVKTIKTELAAKTANNNQSSDNDLSQRLEQIVSSGPATKIIFLHFDFPPGFLFAQSSRRQVR